MIALIALRRDAEISVFRRPSFRSFSAFGKVFLQLFPLLVAQCIAPSKHLLHHLLRCNM